MCITHARQMACPLIGLAILSATYPQIIHGLAYIHGQSTGAVHGSLCAHSVLLDPHTGWVSLSPPAVASLSYTSHTSHPAQQHGQHPSSQHQVHQQQPCQQQQQQQQCPSHYQPCQQQQLLQQQEFEWPSTQQGVDCAQTPWQDLWVRRLVGGRHAVPLVPLAVLQRMWCERQVRTFGAGLVQI